MTQEIKIGDILQLRNDTRLVHLGEGRVMKQGGQSLTCGLTGKVITTWTDLDASTLTTAQIAGWHARKAKEACVMTKTAGEIAGEMFLSPVHTYGAWQSETFEITLLGNDISGNSIRHIGTLRDAKEMADHSFGDGFRRHELSIVRIDGDKYIPVAWRTLANNEWHDL